MPFVLQFEKKFKNKLRQCRNKDDDLEGSHAMKISMVSSNVDLRELILEGCELLGKAYNDNRDQS